MMGKISAYLRKSKLLEALESSKVLEASNFFYFWTEFIGFYNFIILRLGLELLYVSDS